MRAAADPWTKSPEDLAAMLTRAGCGEITAAAIRADVKAGAPRGKGGMINALAYAAWLLRERARGE